MEKIKCPFCGAEMDSNMKYCPFCGKKIEKQNTENHKKENEVFVGHPPKNFLGLRNGELNQLSGE